MALMFNHMGAFFMAKPKLRPHRLGVMFSEKDMERLQEIADRLDLPASTMAYMIVKRFISEQYGEGFGPSVNDYLPL